MSCYIIHGDKITHYRHSYALHLSLINFLYKFEHSNCVLTFKAITGWKQQLSRQYGSPDGVAYLFAEEDNFFFGLATAPAHVEDRLEDAWLQFATETSCDDNGNVRDQRPVDALMASAAGDGGSQQSWRSIGGENIGDREQRKPLRVAMEAMLRGFEILAESGESAGGDNCSHNVAAWHNVPCP